ncbi:hypothetical protein V1279_002970 [Bradyrhizobium sp. AZCC 1610]|uniref:ATP-binding protein n=1 Tax=Bradyrhizobium sp. AZCC 1610 TaxID=3117020 RepID=UPI002FF38B51
MKLGMQEHTDIATGVQEEFDVEIEANAVAIYAQISGLAKDKVGYGVREIPSNAWDASGGNFEVHLPTPLNPVFRVRDYGTGISPENMKKVYGKLYASDKRGANDKVGGWGLGSKSPFAYLLGPDGAGSFNVTSYYEGVMRAYVVSLSAEGKIKVRQMAEMPSDEPSGLDVSYAVRREDIHAFHNRAHKILWSFNPRPKIFPEIKWDEPVVKSSGDNWTSYKSGTVPFYGPSVRMGCVMYPFDLSLIKNSGFLDSSDEVLFEAPIGSLKVILSREELAYDETTKATLATLVKNYEDSFINQLRAKVEAADTLFNACVAFNKGVEGLGLTRAERLRTMMDWRGLPLTNNVVKHNFKTCHLGNGWQQFDKFTDETVLASWAADAKIVIEHNPHYSFSRFSMANLVGEKVLWVRCKRIDRDETLRRLGNPEVIDLDSFKVPVEKRVSKTIRKRRTLVVGTHGRLRKETQDVDLADGGYFIEQRPYGYRRGRGNEWFHVMDGHSDVSLSSLDDVTHVCVELGLIEAGTVILIKKHDQEVPDGWTHIGDDIVEGLRGKVNVAEFTGLHKKTINHIDGTIRRLVDPRLFDNAPADLQEWAGQLRALYRTLEGNSTASTESDKACAALQKLGVSVNKPSVECPIAAVEARFNELTLGYPLLRMICSNSSFYGFDNAAKQRLKHYFDLLRRPEIPVVQDNDEDFDSDAEDFDVDLDEAA